MSPSASPPDASSAPVERIRWRWVLVCFGVGLLLTLAPFVLEDRWGWTGVAPSTMTNLGTAFLLAAVLFFLERKFVTTVRRAAGQAVAGVANELRQTTADLRTSIDELQAAAAQRAADAATEQDAAVARLGDDVSFETLTGALSEAYDMRALDGDSVTVLAGASLAAPRFMVSWLRYEDDLGVGTGEALVFRYVPARKPNPGRTGTPVVRRRWMPSTSAADFGAELIREMQKNGFGPEAKQFDYGTLFANLRAALADALAARRDESWFNGSLIEYANPWAVTSVGLEHRLHGVVLQADAFPPASGSKAADAPKRTPRPAAPAWADQGDFDWVYEWAQAYFPPAPLAAAYHGHDRVQRVLPRR